MKKYTLLLILLLLPSFAQSQDLWKNRIVPTSLLVSGIGIASVWTMELISQENVNVSGGFFNIRDRKTNQILWPHLLAEYGTAMGLVIGAIGLYKQEEWGRIVSLISAGALAYTSLNSLSWVLSDESRKIYMIPMLLSLTAAGVTFVVLF